VDGIDFLEDPDVEDLGITSELAGGVAEDHFNIVTNWVNPCCMQWDTRDFHAKDNGYNAPSTGGPNVTDILKQISNWDKLSDLTPTGVPQLQMENCTHAIWGTQSEIPVLWTWPLHLSIRPHLIQNHG
jgi:hypothetical protein